MSGSIQTDIDRPLPNEDDRELARRYLIRKGYADLIPILGLDDAPIRSSRRAERKQAYATGSRSRTKGKVDLDIIEGNKGGDRA